MSTGARQPDLAQIDSVPTDLVALNLAALNLGALNLVALNQEIIACIRCPRLIAHCRKVGREKRRAYLDWDYWARPVPSFGDPGARLLILGLAPGAHGSNRTGRPFTGDG